MKKFKRKALVLLIQSAIVVTYLKVIVYTANGIAMHLVDDGVPHGFGLAAPIGLGLVAVSWSTFIVFLVFQVGINFGGEKND